jgi:hypothetical protein
MHPPSHLSVFATEKSGRPGDREKGKERKKRVKRVKMNVHTEGFGNTNEG